MIYKNSTGKQLVFFLGIPTYHLPLRNVITYNATISACGGSGQWQRALQLFADCNTTLKPSIVTYNAATRWSFFKG